MACDRMKVIGRKVSVIVHICAFFLVWRRGGGGWRNSGAVTHRPLKRVEKIGTTAGKCCAERRCNRPLLIFISLMTVMSTVMLSFLSDREE